MFQMRTGGPTGDSYAVPRDIINLFPRLAETAAIRLGQAGWGPTLQAWAVQAGLSEKDLVPAAMAFARFMNLATHQSVGSFGDVWEQSGMARLPIPVLMALMFQLGAGTTATYFQLIRESQRPGYAPRDTPLVQAVADQVAHALDAPSERIRQRRTEEIKKGDLLD